MTRLPDALVSLCNLGVYSFAEAAQAVWSALGASGLPHITSFAVPAHGPERTDGLEEAVAHLVDRSGRPPDMRLELGTTGSGMLSLAQEGRDWVLDLHLANWPDEEAFLSLLAKHARLLRELLRSGLARRASVKRRGAGLKCLPVVPVAETVQLLITDEAEVTAAYDDPVAFWAAGWQVETFGERILLSRAMGCADRVEYLDVIQPHQWAMARAAKAGQTRYFAPQPLDDELPVYQAGEPRLVSVGHLSQGNIVEYSSVLGPDEHLQGWEIFGLRGLLSAGALADGRPVDSVRVVFLDREMALRERRPLLDIGVRVFCQAAEKIEEITS